ncbi:MAG TPA: FtsX-like permease family protein [Acidimicrobiales bacterium]|nr:FtsX-like permease family protein [Acidimicrobiales bacterium]
MFKTTIKGLLAQKLRFALTGLAVLLGVSFMAGTMILTDTVKASFDGLFTEVNRGTDAVVRAKGALSSDFGGETRGRVPETLVDTVSAVPGVGQAEGFVQGFAQLVDRKGKALGNPDQGAPTLGMSWGRTQSLNPFRLSSGHAPDGPTEVVIDRGSAKKGHFKAGDKIKVLTKGPTREFTVAGIARFGDADSPLGASIASFDLATAQQVIGEPGTVDQVVAVADSGLSQDKLAAAIRDALPADSVEVLTGAQYTKENQSDIGKGLSFFNAFLLTFAMVALFVGAFIIYNTFGIVVAQRTRELALLRALGASRRQVLRSVLGEAVVVGLVASFAGLVVGIGVASGLKALLQALGIDIPATGTVIKTGTVVVSMLTGTLVTVFSAVMPARRAGRIAPVAAMRDVAVENTSRSTRRAVAGAVVTGLGALLLVAGLVGSGGSALPKVGLGAAVMFVGVAVLGPVLARPLTLALGWPIARLRGVSGALAKQNALRNPKRTSATAAALTVGVGLVGFITIFAASAKVSINDTIDKAMRADLVLQGHFSSGVSPALADSVRKVDGVDSASGIRVGQAEIDGGTKQITAVDPASIANLFDVGITAGSLTGLDKGIAVYTGIADQQHWKVGDVLHVRFPETGVKDLALVATFDRKDVAGNYVVSTGTYDANFADHLDFAVYVKLAKGADGAGVRTQLQRIVDTDYPSVKLQDRTEFKKAQARQIDQMLNLIYALLLLAVLIAVIGIANTLALSIYERTRELGLLRAVGMTRGQLRSTVRWESVIIALFGTVLGLVIGAFFGWSMVKALADEGFTTFRLPVGSLLTVAVLAALAGVAAAIGPARRSAKLDVLAAISAP